MPDIGEVRLRTHLAPGLLDQRRETLDPEQSLSEVLTGGSGDTVTVGGHSRHVIGYMKDFLFVPSRPVPQLACSPAARFSGQRLARDYRGPASSRGWAQRKRESRNCL